MKQHWASLQLRCQAPKRFNLAIASRRAAFDDNASLIAAFLQFNISYREFIGYCLSIDNCLYYIEWTKIALCYMLYLATAKNSLHDEAIVCLA